MACYDPDTEEYQSVCRVMSGFSDAFYREVRNAIKLILVSNILVIYLFIFC